ncbi:hypothetical protein HZB94_01330 [Candidatus Falkowbacteria bacterium]|nr:hypothetical protein [Candidatus Falkowbacteria bacterium]
MILKRDMVSGKALAQLIEFVDSHGNILQSVHSQLGCGAFLPIVGILKIKPNGATGPVSDEDKKTVRPTFYDIEIEILDCASIGVHLASGGRNEHFEIPRVFIDLLFNILNIYPESTDRWNAFPETKAIIEQFEYLALKNVRIEDKGKTMQR